MTTALGTELAALFRRDVARLAQQIRAFPDDCTLWRTLPGITNSAGNLALHLEGNLREFIGRQLGGVAYTRQRDLEFSTTSLAVEALAARIDALSPLIPDILAGLGEEDFTRQYPQNVLGTPLSTAQFVIHLAGHLNYHLGQIDYLRRVLTSSGPIALAALPR